MLPAQGEGRIRPNPLRVEGILRTTRRCGDVDCGAATASVDYGGLAPQAGATLTQTMERSLGGGSFLAMLAAGPSRMYVAVLSYQVHD